MGNKTVKNLVESMYWNGETGLNCAQTVLVVTMNVLGEENSLYKDVASAFGGGVCGTHINLCGAISGALMVIGIKETENKNAVGKELLDYIEKNHKSLYCDKIINIDFTDQAQVDREKRNTEINICKPMIVEICEWLVERYT